MASPPAHAVSLSSAGATLFGDLTRPDQPIGVVLFAHGSGSSRMSLRNRWVAAHLVERRLATLLFDLLTTEEERLDAFDAHLRFDIELLAERLAGATEWLRSQPAMRDLPAGYFGASTGAAAALIAAAQLPERIFAVVSRGGRPDLAGSYLPWVTAPTLFIVGGADTEVLRLNREAARRMKATHQVAVVPRATHLFEEPGALDAVASLAGDWFADHLGAAQPGAGVLGPARPHSPG